MPLNDDDVLTIDSGISAYTSASSSNINPFNASGASRVGGGDDDDRAAAAALAAGGALCWRRGRREDPGAITLDP